MFGKNPKYLNDFSGSTIRLLDILMDAGVPIRGIFLQRCPLNTFTSILERKFRLDEMFGGDMEQYEDFVFDALEFSISTGNKVSDRYDFLRIRYEELGQEFPRLLDYMEIQDGGSKLAGFQKKYHRRYILNPRARVRYESLKTFARKLGYDGKQYPKKVGVGAFLAELCGTLIRVQRSHKSNVNNPERPWGVIKKVFWLEVQTDKFNGLRKIYKYWKNK